MHMLGASHTVMVLPGPLRSAGGFEETLLWKQDSGVPEISFAPALAEQYWVSLFSGRKKQKQVECGSSFN